MTLVDLVSKCVTLFGFDKIDKCVITFRPNFLFGIITLLKQTYSSVLAAELHIVCQPDLTSLGRKIVCDVFVYVFVYGIYICIILVDQCIYNRCSGISNNGNLSLLLG